MSEVSPEAVARAVERRLAGRIQGLSSQLQGVEEQVDDVKQTQRQTESTLLNLLTRFEAYVRKDELDKNKQLAQTRVGEVKADIERDFGHHNEVRRSATGILQAFDSGLVSEDTVRQITEELMIKSPRYWLAPALVGLAAWTADRRELCEQATEEAFRRSPAKTSLLFALVLRRQDRAEASVRWLRHYLLHQNPMALGREFQVILECASQGAFGPAGRALLQETLAKWREDLLDDDAVRSAQVSRWRGEIEGLRGPSTTAEFPRLAESCPQWDRLDAALVSARVHATLLDRFEQLMAQPTPASDRLEDEIDAILDRLVGDYDAEELPLRRTLLYHELVVRHDGDEEAARRESDLKAPAFDETRDYLTVQSTAALDPASVGASPAAQKLAVASCHEWLAEAHAGFARDYRAALPTAVDVRFGKGGSRTADGPGFEPPLWTQPIAHDLADLKQSLRRHYDRHIAAYVKSLAYDVKKQLQIMLAVLLPGFMVLLAINVKFAFIAVIFAAGVWGVVVYNRSETARTAQNNAEQSLRRRRDDALTQLGGVHAEWTDWRKRYREADAGEAHARAFIASLATAANGATPFDGRVVGANGFTGRDD
ncbi:hypothetical protein [Streptomyces panaciradicis]|uniref:hypothetical protein n=1 Tax=Streptomyces panaciradicis TaxID=1470261 RepID=UPI00201CBB67|nr:hypothetical protein [Streptomyces panaciradicis]MCL6673253.1 hypothetical protein [Streptomyces panaciradicis]